MKLLVSIDCNVLFSWALQRHRRLQQHKARMTDQLINWQNRLDYFIIHHLQSRVLNQETVPWHILTMNTHKFLQIPGLRNPRRFISRLSLTTAVLDQMFCLRQIKMALWPKTAERLRPSVGFGCQYLMAGQ